MKSLCSTNFYDDTPQAYHGSTFDVRLYMNLEPKNLSTF